MHMMLDLLGPEFQSGILNMLKELKKNMSKELKESLRMKTQQVESIGKDTEIIKKEPNEMLELKTITETKISLEINSQFEQAEERIGDLEIVQQR